MTNEKSDQKASKINQKETRNYISSIKNTLGTFKPELLKNIRKLDWTILLLTLTLIVIGLISVFSATLYMDSYNIIITQTLSVILGCFAAIAILSMPYRWFENIYLLLILLLIIMFILAYLLFTANIIGGSSSWLEIFGLSIQPSEFVKILGILIMSWMVEYSHEELIISETRVIKKPDLFISALLFITSLLIVAQPDIGMTAIILVTLLTIYMIVNTSKTINFASYAIVIVGYILVIVFGQYYADELIGLDFHVLDRIGSFINPFDYPTDSGYQLIQGLLAFSRGGWFGVGIGQGIAKEGSLPVIESDYILANIGEEMGLIGVFIVLGLLLALIIVIYQRAAVSQSIFRKATLIGIGTVLFIQTVVNVGGVVSVLPLTGVTLPFISAGGSSMIVSVSLIGLALRMIAEDRKEPNINLVYSKERGMSDGI